MTEKKYKRIYNFLAPILKLIFRLDIKGRENVPESGGALVCSNHISLTDPMSIIIATVRPVRFMAKKELFHVPLVSSFIKAFGAYPVDRKANDVGALRKTMQLLTEGDLVGIFPQGHRHPREDPRKTAIKFGAAMVACRTGSDVLPVYVKCKNNKFIAIFRKTEVIIGKPIKFSEFNYVEHAPGEYARITNMIFERVCSLGD